VGVADSDLHSGGGVGAADLRAMVSHSCPSDPVTKGQNSGIIWVITQYLSNF